MAKFGQSFLAQATQPVPGLFEAFQSVGAMPAAARAKAEAKAQEEKEKGMLSGLVPGSVEYNQKLAEIQLARGDLAGASVTGASALEQQKTQQEAATKQATKTRLMGAALQKAKNSLDAEDYPSAVARITSMSEQQLTDYLKPKEPKDPIQLVQGARLVDPDTKKVIIEARDAPTKQTNVAFELLKGGKYDPTSFKYNEDGTLSGDLSGLRLAEDKRGSIPTNVENQIIKMDSASGKSLIEFGRARKLREELLVSPDKSSGIVSSLRTQVLDFAGLRDAEEEAKTEFLRKRNTDIINSLPPGVASDTDVRIFSQGFPSENAKSEEIIRYLEAEERILAAQADMSALFQQHVNKQVESGIEATTAGFEFERRKYADIMTNYRNKVENAKNEQGLPLYTEEQKRRFLQEALGFVPTYYSR